MFLKRLQLQNWKNFKECDLEIGSRLFVVGPNASGKSNLLDVVRFLRDIAKKGGGLQTAISERGGLSKIRSLSARHSPHVEISIEVSKTLYNTSQPDWKYSISLSQESRGWRRPILRHEKVWNKSKLIITRPDEEDKSDQDRLTQTYLEQVNANKAFRDIPNYLEKVQYLHIVPQLVRHAKLYTGPGIPGDPFGQHFLNKIAESTEKTRKSRLRKIEKILKNVVPQLKEFSFKKDNKGYPHLEAVYEHWRPKGAGKQREDQFSDGTLRVIGFLWALFESDSLLLLEEPELSLHSEVVRQLPALIFKVLKSRQRQIMITTHSAELLSDRGLGSDEVVTLTTDKEGTKVQLGKDNDDIHKPMISGLTAAEVIIPQTGPKNIGQLSLFSTD